MIRRCISLLTALFILAGMFPSFASADPLDNWSARSPLSTNQNMNGVIYGNGMYVAVGDYGTIVSSGDGLSWMKRTSDTGNHLLDIAFGNGRYVAVGSEGTILTSSDGVNWTYHTSGTAKLLGVTYGSGGYVAVGEGGTAMTSSDGMNWTSRTSGTANNLNDVTFGNGKYLAVGDRGITLASSDGMSWTTNYTDDLENLNGIAYGNNMYVAVGNREAIKSSSDGVSWTSKAGNSSSIKYLGTVVYGNGKYVALGYPGMVEVSVDGDEWDISTTGAWRMLSDVIYGNGMYVAVGDSGTIMTSSDGANWTNRTLGTSSILVDVTYGNSTYVAVGQRATIVTSSDGMSWTNRTAGTFNNLFGVTYGNGRYVAVGGMWGDGTIVTSSDGVSWTNRTSGIKEILNGVTYGDGTYVAVGDNGTILTSGDGASWTNRLSGSAYPLYGVTYGDGTYVAVGYKGMILTSSDGASWTSRTTDTFYDFHGVTYGNGMYVAVGEGGIIVTSSDGENWMSHTLDTGNQLMDVSYSNGIYMAVGGSKAIFTSSNGANWTSRITDIVNSLYGITYGEGSYVAVGDAGTILQSGNYVPTTYTLTYNGNGSTEGTVPTDSGAYEQNASVTVQGNTGSLMKTGNTFVGWNTSADGSGTSYTANDTFSMEAANVTLYAQWSADLATHTVTFDSKGGSAVASITGVNEGTTVSVPAEPTRSGYTFTGWYKEASYVTPWNFGTDTVTENTTLYAKWTADPAPMYTVTFDSKGGSAVASITYVSSGATISAPAAPTKSGYTFAGWYKEATYATSWNFGTDTVTENTTLYAKWTAIPAPATYTVTFDSQGGSTVTNITNVSSGATISAPAAPTKSGYTFTGWYREASYVTPWNFGTDTVTENTTLYAKWTAIPAPATYTVTFDSQGGSTVTDITYVSSGATISAPAAPTKSGYTFAGWYKEATYATSWNFGTDTVTENITLYAKWTAIPAPATYTVTFDSQGGSTVTDITYVSSGATITAPAEPTRSGYTFAGWYKEANYVTPWNFSTDTVTADSTLYAKWMAVPGSGGDGGVGGGVGGGSGGVPIPTNDSKVISKDGVLSLPAGKHGEVHLGDEITIGIPANATEKDLILTIKKVLETQSLLLNNEVPVSPIFEILKNFPENFKKPVTLTLVFEPASLKEGQTPAIFYFDEATRKWARAGGIVKGNQMIVEVDHLGKYAVLAVDQPSEVKVSLNDIAGHWAEADITQAIKDGIIEGYPDETFKPNIAVTRGEFAVMLVKALKLQDEGGALTFTDTTGSPDWARKAIAQAVQADIIKGYEDGTFRPNAAITRAEMATMIAKSLKLSIEGNTATGFADDKNIPSWAKGVAAALKKIGIMEGTGANQFNSAAKATRAEAVTILLRMLEQQSK